MFWKHEQVVNNYQDLRNTLPATIKLQVTCRKYLQGTKDAVPSGSPNKANIQKSTERPPLISWFNREVFTSGLRKKKVNTNVEQK
jgi:hypothetical protein